MGKLVWPGKVGKREMAQAFLVIPKEGEQDQMSSTWNFHSLFGTNKKKKDLKSSVNGIYRMDGGKKEKQKLNKVPFGSTNWSLQEYNPSAGEMERYNREGKLKKRTIQPVRHAFTENAGWERIAGIQTV